MILECIVLFYGYNRPISLAMANVTTPHVGKNSILLWKDEYDLVKEPNIENVKKIRDKTTVILGLKDNWVPNEYHEFFFQK